MGRKETHQQEGWLENSDQQTNRRVVQSDHVGLQLANPTIGLSSPEPLPVLRPTSDKWAVSVCRPKGRAELYTLDGAICYYSPGCAMLGNANHQQQDRRDSNQATCQ